MGLVCLLLGMLGVCIGWIPSVGWVGVIMGVCASALGVPSILYWHQRPGYLAWGISGSLLGITAASVGLAFQIKHAGGSLDFLLYELPTPKAYLFLGISFFALIVGFLLGRFRSRALGIIIASTAILSLTLSGSFTLITADRAMTKSELQIDP